MIIKVFKVSTAEMWTMKDKTSLVTFIEQETGSCVSNKMTIKTLMRYLPVEDYCRVK